MKSIKKHAPIVLREQDDGLIIEQEGDYVFVPLNARGLMTIRGQCMEIADRIMEHSSTKDVRFVFNKKAFK